MSQLTDLLSELVNVEGINSAVVVGRDGFVIEGVASERAWTRTRWGL